MIIFEFTARYPIIPPSSTTIQVRLMKQCAISKVGMGALRPDLGRRDARPRPKQAQSHKSSRRLFRRGHRGAMSLPKAERTAQRAVPTKKKRAPKNFGALVENKNNQASDCLRPFCGGPASKRPSPNHPTPSSRVQELQQEQRQTFLLPA